MPWPSVAVIAMRLVTHFDPNLHLDLKAMDLELEPVDFQTGCLYQASQSSFSHFDFDSELH